MELVYLWVEDYKNIHKQGFNFSPRFECKFHDKYDENGKLKENCKLEIIEKKEDEYIKDFFGENINVTAIVGKNGSGKSSLLNAIQESIKDESHNIFNYILVYSFKNIRYYISNVKIKSSITLANHFSNINTLIYKYDITIEEEYQTHYFSSSNAHFFMNRKKEITNVLTFNCSKDDANFRIATFMYLPNQIEITLKDENGLRLKLDKEGINRTFFNENFIKFITPQVLKLSDLNREEKELIMGEKYFHFFDFDFIDKENRRYNNLSHGEQMFFGQLITIYFYSLHNDNLLFLFDEPEISLHPDWQKRYINEIYNLLKKMKGNNHFIFTSHSPFLLSDIPKQNIIFLDTYKKEDEEVKSEKQKIANCKVVNGLNEKKQTFGANIHTLLSDSFFMEDGLMGEFAKGKIEEIKEFYEKAKLEKKTDENIEFYEEHKEKFWQIQSIIGEPFLQTVIKNYLDELELLFSDDNTLIEKELADIEKRKAYLESLKNV